jgi:hypothetical protein
VQGEVDVAIGPVSYPGLSSGLFAASASGKPARSLFRLLHRHADSTLMEVGAQHSSNKRTTSATADYTAASMWLSSALTCTMLQPLFICVPQVTILTGRPHQIRIHMAALGHPLLGDPLYGPGGTPKVS